MFFLSSRYEDIDPSPFPVSSASSRPPPSNHNSHDPFTERSRAASNRIKLPVYTVNPAIVQRLWPPPPVTAELPIRLTTINSY